MAFENNLFNNQEQNDSENFNEDSLQNNKQQFDTMPTNDEKQITDNIRFDGMNRLNDQENSNDDMNEKENADVDKSEVIYKNENIDNNFDNLTNDQIDVLKPQNDFNKINLPKKTFDIQHESAKIFGISEKQLERQFNVFKYKKLVAQFDYLIENNNLSSNEILNKCNDAIKYGFNSVVTYPDKVLFVKKKLPKLNVCALIGYPNGNGDLKCNVNEIKKSVRSGAKEINVVFDLSLLKDRKYRMANKYLKKYRRVAGKNKLIISINIVALSEEELNHILKLIIANKVDSVCFTCTGDGIIFEQTLKNAMFICRGQISTCAYLYMENISDGAEILMLGVQRLLLNNAVDIADKIRKGLYIDLYDE